MVHMKICAANAQDKPGQSKQHRAQLQTAPKRTTPPAYLHTFVFDSVEITKPFQGCGARFFGRHAVLNVFTQEQFDMKMQLFFNLEFELSTLKTIAQSC